MDDSDFYLGVAHALSGCQLVEQELKLYITEALELVKKCLAGKLPFSMSGEDYDDASLERLIDTFRKLSNSPSLVADLRKFKDERNFLSHRSIAECLDPDGQLNYRPADFQTRLAAIAPEAERLRTAIHLEANKFRGHLWFEDLTVNDP
ncbi:MAG: hypothetical protein WBC67_17850 [Candidatus Acidiferrales bacterium]